MTTARISPDYCAHGVGIDLPCVECERWHAAVHRGQDMSEPHVIMDAVDDYPYPTVETLTRIESWQIHTANDVRACLDYVKDAWDQTYGSAKMVESTQELAVLVATKGERFLRLATGGWSGNEALVAALKRNGLVSSLAWCLSARGGLHIYRY